MHAAFRRYLHDFLAHAKGQALRGVAYSFASALTEGIGLLLLLPILQLVAGESEARFAQWLQTMLGGLGFVSTGAQVVALVVGFMALIVLRNLVSWRRTVILARISQGFVDHWRKRVFQALANAQWQSLLKVQQHEGQHAIVQDVNRLGGGTNQIMQGGVSAIMIAVQLAVSAIVAPALTALVIILIGVAALIMPRLLRRAQKLGRRQTVAGQRMQQTLIQFLAGLKLVKVYRTETKHISFFTESAAAIRREILQFGADQVTAQALFQVASATLLSMTVLIGLFGLDTAPLTLIAVVVIMARLAGPLFGLMRGIQQIANMLPAYEALTALEARLSNTGEPVKDMNPKPEGALPVVFQDVSFAYDGSDTAAVASLNISIQPGQMVALIGPSGAGKTTVLDMMSGLLLPNDGEVRIGGLSTSDPANREAIAHAIGYVPQDPFLIDCSLREALLSDTTDASPQAIEEAIRLTGADKIVAGLPDGLDTLAGDRGQRLSGGERQRFCMARALLRAPGLLILDEATSALDRTSERRIFEGLRDLRSHMTIVVVTHREVDPTLFDQIMPLAPENPAKTDDAATLGPA